MQIRAFKEKIAPTLNIEPESQRMIFCGRVLADDKTLKDYSKLFFLLHFIYIHLVTFIR